MGVGYLGEMGGAWSEGAGQRRVGAAYEPET